MKLGQVNLFIGPNNSGKSNYLKGIELLKNIISPFPDKISMSESHFEALMPRGKIKSDVPGKSSINYGIWVSDYDGKPNIGFNGATVMKLS